MIKYYYTIETQKEDCESYEAGDMFWFRNNELHRESLPAVKYSNGYQMWYINGKFIKDFSIEDEEL